MSESDILVVQSKLKSYIKDKSGMSTSGAVAGKISEMVRHLCDQAIANAEAAKRKTVMDRDFEHSAD